MGNGPLTGIKVLDLTQFEAGTVCTETLAWLGAEIWKVERPVKGELGRYSAVAPGIDTYGFILLNMNKKSITCNLKSSEGIALIKKLLEKADVIVENMGPGSMERLGLSYEECKAINDKIVYASIKGFARNSPYADFPAFDPVATHTGGLVSVTGLPDMPVKSGVSVADSGSGIMTAAAIIAAVYTKALLSAIPVPSLQNRRERILLKGELTSPIDPKNCCRFAPRCIHATEQCFASAPQLTDVGDGHKVACHRVAELNNLSEV